MTVRQKDGQEMDFKMYLDSTSIKCLAIILCKGSAYQKSRALF